MQSTTSFSKRSVGSVAIGALLIFSIYTILPMTPAAYAQATSTITTSADSHGNKFFGPALLEVMFQSSQHAADNSVGTAQVSITAFGTSQTYSMNETSGTSGIFLMYVKVDETAGAEQPLIPANPFSNTMTRLYVGPSGVAGSYPASSGSNTRAELATTNIAEGGTIQLTFGGVTKTVTYDDSSATLTLDRSNYGSDTATKIYAVIYDPDINLDPTTSNTITELNPPSVLLSRSSVTPTGNLTFTETGTNTARFETVLNVVPLTGGTSSGRSLTATDYKTFVGTNTTHVETTASSQGTSSASYTVSRVSGSFGPVNAVTYAGELSITINDSDRNVDSKAQGTLSGRLNILHPGSGASGTGFDLREQSLSSNTFVPAFSQNRLTLTWKEATAASQGVLNLLPGQEATLRYNDTVPSSGGPQITSSITIGPSNTDPILTSDKTTVGRSSVIMLTMADPELNDDAQIVESYTVVFNSATTHADGTVAPFSGVSPFSMKIDRNGASMPLTSDFSVTFTETGEDTGIFIGEADLSDLGAVLSGGTNGEPLSDGDILKFEVDDILEPGESSTASVTATVGLEKPRISIDRTTLPVPRLEAADDALTPAAPNPQVDISNTGPVSIVITITDPNRNNSTINQEVLVAGGSGSSTGLADASSHVHNTFDGGRLVLTLTAAPGTSFNGATTINIGDALQETGFDTGVFQGTIEVTADGTDNDRPLWIGAKLKVEYKGLSLADSSDDASSVTVTFTARQAVLTTDTSTVVNGGEVTFTVSDQDANRDPEEAESVYVRIQWSNAAGAPQDRFLELEETGDNTGVFRETVAVGDDQIDGVTFSVEADSEVDVFYYDATTSVSASKTNPWPTLGGSNGRHERTLSVQSASGALEIGITGTTVGPSSAVDVTVFDTDENTNPNTRQTITGLITIATDRGVNVQLNLEETEGNSARFEGTINLIPDPTPADDGVGTPSGTDVEIEVLPGDVISVRYEDQSDASGSRTTISRQFTVISVDPEITVDKTVYAPGDQMTITLADLDADRDPDSNDIRTIRATSTSDLVGLSSVQLIETGPNTGVFTGTLTLTSQFTSGSLTVRNGDIVTIRYTDQFPADYKDRVDAGGTTNKDFLLTVQVGGSVTGSTTPTAPAVTDAQGRPISQVLAGQQVVLASTITNNEDTSGPFVALVEVRDSNGVTIYLQWQEGTLAANGSVNVGISWTPDSPGTYTVRVFVLSSLVTPQILSPVVTSTVNVS